MDREKRIAEKMANDGLGIDMERVINDLQDAVNDNWMWRHADYYALTMERAIALLKEQKAVTEYVIDEFQPTCKTCGFRPFAGYIPTLEWMKERGFRFCPNCRRRIKWNEQAGN